MFSFVVISLLSSSVFKHVCRRSRGVLNRCFNAGLTCFPGSSVGNVRG